jgi:NAD(P)-dependent dehydrogenase (short-subunit alcohol dehydrogenase family)
MNRATGHRFVGRDETAKARLVGSIPAKRAATMGEISETIVFIAAKAPYLTGRSIAVDGGYRSKQFNLHPRCSTTTRRSP